MRITHDAFKEVLLCQYVAIPPFGRGKTSSRVIWEDIEEGSDQRAEVTLVLRRWWEILELITSLHVFVYLAVHIRALKASWDEVSSIFFVPVPLIVLIGLQRNFLLRNHRNNSEASLSEMEKLVVPTHIAFSPTAYHATLVPIGFLWLSSPSNTIRFPISFAPALLTPILARAKTFSKAKRKRLGCRYVDVGKIVRNSIFSSWNDIRPWSRIPLVNPSNARGAHVCLSSGTCIAALDGQ